VSTCRPLDQPLEGTLGLAPPQSLLPGWRDSLEVKSTCSCRGPRFYSQHPHGGS
ncbi:hypothetical protein LEMLEM_LOCUS5447, partial [Lemmus lemmus]